MSPSNRGLLLITVCLTRLAAAPADVFAPYLRDESPRIVETLSHDKVDGVEVTRLRFLNRIEPNSGRPVHIYAILARPTTPGPHPGVLVCHGGGGYADQVEPQVIGWAKRGYVSVCQDEPGICDRSKARSSGPCLEGNAGLFNLTKAAEDCALFDGVAAGLNGLALLRSQPDVDRARVGVTGGSWGGYMTTMVSSLAGDRIKAAFCIYGCGFYDVGSTWMRDLDRLGPERRTIWLDNLDVGRRAKGLRATYMVAAPTNDWFFWPSAVMRTYAELGVPKNICFTPNDSHQLLVPGGTGAPPVIDHRANRTWMEQVWLNLYLKGEGQPFPSCGSTRVVAREGAALRVEFKVTAPALLTNVTVWYAAGELPWRLKWWAPATAKAVGEGVYQAVVPVDEPGQPLCWFGLVADQRHVCASTLIDTIDPAQHGFKPDEASTARFAQGFEDASEDRRWHKPHLERRAGRFRLCAEAAHSGRRGLELSDEATFACWGVRAATLKRTGAKELALWLRAAEKPCPRPAIDLLAEGPDGQRYTWRWPAGTAPLSTTWQEVVLPLSELRYTGKGEPPVPLWSSSLGLLRLTMAPGDRVYLDDVTAR